MPISEDHWRTETASQQKGSELPAGSVRLSRADVSAIVVTYNPDDSSLKCISRIANELVHTVVIDNGSKQGPMEHLRAEKSSRITLVENTTNLGVATALNQGVKTAAAMGFRVFLLFDQDTEILPSTLDELIETFNDCTAELGHRLGLLGANFFHRLECGSVAEAKVPFCMGRRWITYDMVITSGTLISLESFNAIGSFREDFFIDHVDHEYCLRARKLGYVVCRTAQPVMVHRLGNLGTRRAWLAFGKKKFLSNYSPLRRYYQMRNFNVLSREFVENFPSEIEDLRKGMRRDVSRAIKYEGCIARTLASVVLAFWHSRRGVNGKYTGKLL